MLPITDLQKADGPPYSVIGAYRPVREHMAPRPTAQAVCWMS